MRKKNLREESRLSEHVKESLQGIADIAGKSSKWGREGRIRDKYDTVIYGVLPSLIYLMGYKEADYTQVGEGGVYEEYHKELRDLKKLMERSVEVTGTIGESIELQVVLTLMVYLDRLQGGESKKLGMEEAFDKVFGVRELKEETTEDLIKGLEFYVKGSKGGKENGN